MTSRFRTWTVLAAVLALALAACSTDAEVGADTTVPGADATVPSADTTAPAEEGDTTETTEATESTDPTDNEWFDQELFDKQEAERGVAPEGPADQPWLQHINAEMVDTSEYASDGPKKLCFANASISNPWRQTGWITMNQQLDVLIEEGVFSEMETRDAQDSDDTQIADIDYFINEGNCDAFIISPNSTRSEERRVGKECRSQWWRYREKKKREQ